MNTIKFSEYELTTLSNCILSHMSELDKAIATVNNGNISGELDSALATLKNKRAGLTELNSKICWHIEKAQRGCKMKEIKNRLTFTYDADNGFYVDIVVEANERGAWLYHKEYGIKMFMFGAINTDPNTFLDMIQNNLATYIEDYEADYMDDEGEQDE